MPSKKKQHLAAAAKLILFLLLFAMAFSWAQFVLTPKTSATRHLHQAQQLPENSVDVLLVGSSHVQSTIQPAQLFGEFGIASINAATSAQSIANSYYVINDLLEHQNPKLVVLDLFCLFYPEISFSEARNHQVLDHMPITANKIAAVHNLSLASRLELLLPLLYYRNRWSGLTQEDYRLEPAHGSYSFRTGVQSFTEPIQILEETDTAEIHPIPLEYFEKIIARCKDAGVQLLLTVVPYRADVDNNETAWQYQQQVYNAAQLLAAEQGVDFLNTLHCVEDVGLDFTRDMMEWSHMNYSGAEKVTHYYGAYLKDHYDLPDRSQDPDYAPWHADYQAYLEELQAYFAAEQDT